jgi:homoserine dehydrogenase
MDKKNVNLGLLGLGVVGSELALQVNKNAKRIENELGVVITIKKIYVRTTNKTRDIDTTTLPLTTNVNDVINNPDIDIICECMGGNGFDDTRNFILQAINNKKHIVLSSKKMLALYANEILLAANKNNVCIKYDASVGGGIPIAKVIEQSFKGDKVVKIMGIFNATSNYIYSKMFSEKISFLDALKSAQDKGYAENNPSDDVDGFDSLYKLNILTMFGLHKIINPLDIKPESFTKIDIRDMQYAVELGYMIKPLALLKVKGNAYEIKVGPCLVPASHLIANTFNNFNSIIIEGEQCGELGFYGQGAGSNPTAFAMFDDLYSILKYENQEEKFPFEVVKKEQLLNYQSKLYWRFTVKNKVGVFAKLTQVLALNEINIEKIIQKDEVAGGIEIVLLTSNVSTDKVERIINELELHDMSNNAVIPFV